MKILIINDPGILVPPKGYGGHERLVYMFAKEYMRLGHEVHLLVTTGSYVEGCKIMPFGKEGFPQTTLQRAIAIPKAWVCLLKHYNRFDLIHNFGRLIYLLPVLNNSVKKIMTYGREINPRNIRYINRLPNKNLFFTGCSNNLVGRGGVAGRWRTIYNAIDFNNYELQYQIAEDAPLIFLGRVESIKGCHTAIKVAQSTGNTLIIAGNISPIPSEQEYFRTQIEPHIDDKQIIYIGQVDDVQKNKWLGKAKALLFPIEWNEPFGIVMIEAMACGTPVVAFNRGSVDEVVSEGITGFKVETKEEMIYSVNNIHNIDRGRCRDLAFQQFDVTIIAKQYLSLDF